MRKRAALILLLVTPIVVAPVKAADDQGRTVENFGSGEGGGTYAFDLKCAPDAKALDLAFAFHRSRFVEFLAKPTLLAPPPNSSAFPSAAGVTTDMSR